MPKDAEIEYKKHYTSEAGAGTGGAAAPQYKGTSAVKYVKKAPATSYAPIYRSKQTATETSKTSEPAKEAPKPENP